MMQKINFIEEKRRYRLFQLRNKQPLRVTIGKSKWLFYENFDDRFNNCNLREVLHDEIVIEFDDTKWNKTLQEFKDVISWPGINFTAVRLYEAKISFEVWDHEGKSPHIHIHNLPITDLSKDDRKLWKETFVKYYTPEEYKDYVDTSLCGIHLVALEWSYHWKGKYGIKRLLHKFNPILDNSPEVNNCVVASGD